MDLYYRALSNAGLWCVGRLQTDADRARVLEGLSSSAAGDGASTAELGHIAKRLAPRWFLMRDVHAGRGTLLLQPRWAMSFLRGPMTLSEIRRAGGKAGSCKLTCGGRTQRRLRAHRRTQKTRAVAGAAR